MNDITIQQTANGGNKVTINGQTLPGEYDYMPGQHNQVFLRYEGNVKVLPADALGRDIDALSKKCRAVK